MTDADPTDDIDRETDKTEQLRSVFLSVTDGDTEPMANHNGRTPTPGRSARSRPTGSLARPNTMGSTMRSETSNRLIDLCRSHH